MTYTPTPEDVATAFLQIKPENLSAHNWGTGVDAHDRQAWNLFGPHDAYINGVVLTVDGDYWMGHLLEVVTRKPDQVFYFVLTTFYGPNRGGRQRLKVARYPLDCGEFFTRTDAASPTTVGRWAVGEIHRQADEFFLAERQPEDQESESESLTPTLHL